MDRDNDLPPLFGAGIILFVILVAVAYAAVMAVVAATGWLIRVVNARLAERA